MSKDSVRPSAPGRRPPQHDDPQARMIAQVFEQIKPHLPIDSLDALLKKVGRIRVYEHELPLELVAPHIARSSFPIKTAKELRRKLDEGIRSAVGLARSGAVEVISKVLSELLYETDSQVGKGSLPRPRLQLSLPIRMRSIVESSDERDKGDD